MAHGRDLGLLTLLALVSPYVELQAQAITTAAVEGRVTGADGAPIGDATVEVTNSTSGQYWRVETSGGGRYFVENVEVGGPYTVAVRAIGFAPIARSGVGLTAGQRYTADFVLQAATAVLPEVVVRGEADPRGNPGRTGPAQLINDSALRQLPNLGSHVSGLNLTREVTELALLSPQVTKSPYDEFSIGGQNPRYTGFLVDGGQNTGLYSGNGPVGYGFLPHSISPEAVAELQVLAAPADVRYGDFAGGLLSVVTRSGTNEWRGSGFGFLQSAGLVGKNAAGEAQQDFTSWQYGASFSGPIVRDRLHFLLSGDLQHQVTPDNGPFITDTAGGADLRNIGIRLVSVSRFDSILTRTYGLAPGDLGRTDTRYPASDLFGKLTAQVGSKNHLELSYHYGHVNESVGVGRGYGYYGLSSVALAQGDRWTENTARLIWRGVIGRRWSNEMILGYLHTQYTAPTAFFPDILVHADSGDIEARPASPAAQVFRVSQGIVELTDNVTVGLGRHLVTFGSHSELLQFKDNNFGGSGGNWDFISLDSLAAGRANHYDRNVPGPLQPNGPNVDFRVRQVGFYAQDQWSVTSRLKLLFGLRMDVPFLPDPGTVNPDVRDSLGLVTGRPPSGNMLWSPRIGFNYDIGGRGATFVRGTLGLYSGPPAYRWIANAYRDSGGEQAFLHCDGSDVPPFNPLHPPLTCAGGGGADPPEPRITVFDPGLKYPQNWKLAVGLDKRLPWGMVGTVDLLYTRWVNEFYLTDANLGPPVGTAAGEGGRLLYGSIAADGSETPSRINPVFGQIVRVSSRGGDNALLASVQLQRDFGRQFGFSASYTYSRVRDAFSLINHFAGANLAHTPLDGSINDRRMGISFFDVPHRVFVAASVGLPLRSRLALIYEGGSQGPYTYVVSAGDANTGDVNADGINAFGAAVAGIAGNDIVYVPKDVRPGGDISLVVRDETTGQFVPAPASVYTQLNDYITAERCLDRQRGRIMERNSCRNPWIGIVNAQLAKALPIPTIRGQSAEITLDIINVLALVKRSWGEHRGTAGDAELSLLRLQGYDATNQRGIYELDLPMRNQVDDYGSRWRMQIGMRYSF